jgi:hypothetical protein
LRKQEFELEGQKLKFEKAKSPNEVNWGVQRQFSGYILVILLLIPILIANMMIVDYEISLDEQSNIYLECPNSRDYLGVTDFMN